MRLRSDGFPQIPRILYPLPRPRSLNYWNMQHVTSQSPLGECTFTSHSFLSQVTPTQRSPTNTITIPRQTGRGSPGPKITWLTVATSGIGGQVVLNDKGKGQKTTE